MAQALGTYRGPPPSGSPHVRLGKSVRLGRARARPAGRGDGKGDDGPAARPPEFDILPIDLLRGHEEHDGAKVEELAAQILRVGKLIHPIWVSRNTWVILNGHHRVAAFRMLGLKWIPAWVFDYDGDLVRLGRWTPGPPIEKAEVVYRAHQGRPFPPKTTRHRLRVELPHRPVPIAALQA